MYDNGFTEYTAVLVDGINMSTLFYGWTAISIFPFTPERIHSAEVIRGGHSVRYGPNTVGGIVNVITTPVPASFVFRERITYGSYNYHSTLTEFGGPIPGSPVRFLGTFVEKGGDTFRDDARFDINEFALKGEWDIGEATRLSFSGFHWRDVHEQPGRLTKAQMNQDREQNPNPTFADWQGWAYGGNFTLHHRLNATDWIQGYGYYRLAQRSLDSPRPTNPPFTGERSADSYMVNEGIGLEGEFGFEAGTAHVLHYGARLHRETINRKTYEVAIAPGGVNAMTQNSVSENMAISLNVDDTIRFGDLMLVLGVRFEHMPVSEARDRVSGIDRDFDLSKFIPGASASYRISDQLAVFANAHKSFRPPQTWSYDFTTKKQDLDFEDGSNFEVGTRWMDVSGFSGSVVLWYVDYSDFIDFDPLTEVYTNLGDYSSRGVDVTFELDAGQAFGVLEGLSTFATATFQDSEFGYGPNKGKDTLYVPEKSGNAGVRYQDPSGLYGVIEAHYWGSAPYSVSDSKHTPSVKTVDIRVGWRRTVPLGTAAIDLDISAASKNVLDRENYLRRGADSYVPGRPREFYGSVSATIHF
jgi:Fe(3+) dicitrate transport protein